MKKIFRFFPPMVLLISSVLHQGCTSLPVSPSGTKPVITHAYCVDKARYGDILKIYVEAEDPQGSMFRVATAVGQVGYGHYPTNWTYPGPQYQHQLIGYLQWNTFSSRASWMPEWTQLTLQVSVFDTAGNESNTIVFPLEFISEATPQPPLPAPFNRGDMPRLGYIDIDLINPFQMREEHEHRLGF